MKPEDNKAAATPPIPPVKPAAGGSPGPSPQNIPGPVKDSGATMAAETTPLSAAKPRVIRVFVSSTFRDMIEDRNELMAQVWPALRRVCRGRAVEFVEVDLRWGVTEEQSQRKETLRHCLAEIKRCRPYFIGLLGERYGWTPGPEAFSPALLDEEDWLRNEVAKHSVTELEILHGVLRDPEMAGRAFFYFRDPHYARSKGGDYLPEDSVRPTRQDALKQQVKAVCEAKRIPLRENYADPRALAALVLADLTAAIDAEFPPDQVPDVWSREDRDHEAYARSRRTDFYVGRDAYFNRLDALAREGANGCGLTVLGESGGGKSALLANWVARWRQAHPGDFVFQHYIGSSAMSAGHLALMRRLPKLLGFSVPGDSLLQKASGLIQGVWHSQVNPVTFALGGGCLLLILALRRWAPRVPGVLLAVVGATLVVGVFDLTARAGVSVVGAMPQGLPGFRWPAVSLDELGPLLAAAVAIAMMSFAETSVLARTFALRAGEETDDNQELIALGAANVAAGLFQGFAVSSSASRTPVAEAAGARTQLTGVVGAGCIALLLVFAPALLRHLPHAALGAVVIAACLALVEVSEVVRLYRLRPGEFALSVVCFLGVALLGVVTGIFMAIGLALLAFIWRAWRPYSAVLARVEGVGGWHDITRHPEGRRIPGLVLFRWDAPLFFANAQAFHDQVRHAVANAPTPTRWVVVAAEPVTDVDITAADALLALDAELHQTGADLFFAEMKGPVKDRLKRYGLFTRLGTGNFFPTIEQAVERYLATHPTEWDAGKK